MGEAGNNGKVEKERNCIHDDAIWRQTVKFELNSAKNWEENWGFIRDAYKDEEKSTPGSKSSLKLPPIKEMKPFASGLPSKLPRGLAMSENSIINDWISGYRIGSIQNYRYPASKYTFPSTTSNEIGWPWSHSNDYGPEENQDNAIKSKYRPRFYTLERFPSDGRKGRDSRWRGNTVF